MASGSLSRSLFLFVCLCSLHGRPLLLWHDSLVSLRLSLVAFLLLPLTVLFLRVVRQCAPLPTFTYHNTQWKNVVSLSNYKIRCECTLHAVHFLRLIAIFFLAAISCAISTQTKNPSKNPLCSKTRDRVSYLFDFYIFITTIYESFVIFDLIKAVVNKSI